jgi:hypothetical protein
MRLVAVFTTICLVLAGCQPASGPNAQQTAKNKDAPKLEFPDTSPDYLNEYPNGKPYGNPGVAVSSAMFKKMLDGGTVGFITTDTSKAILDFYDADLAKAGFVRSDFSSALKVETATYKKGDPTRILITVQVNRMFPGDAVVQITYMNMPQPKQD